MSGEAWRVANVQRSVEEQHDVLLSRACDELGIAIDDATAWRIVRRSIDARGRRAPRFVTTVEVDVASGVVCDERRSTRTSRRPLPRVDDGRRVAPEAARPAIVGMGPCGLFAALRLVAAGLRPTIIERGRTVEARGKDVARLLGRGEIDPESNLCYGEGGAGTFSDGKLYTRVGGAMVRSVLETIVAHGGPPEILVESRPHLGTDRLVRLLKAIRAHLEAAGCDLMFETRIDAVTADDGVVTGLRLADGRVLDASHVVLAPGHSARELYRRLAETGIAMAPKSFAVGFRVEHPQALVDAVQYGRWAGHAELPAAYYDLASEAADGRGVYSFCMCPGGSIVPTPTRSGEICVNGMSHSARSGHYANSAIVVTVEPPDYASFARSEEPVDRLLAGVSFQEAAETRAWELGGGEFVAPAQRLVDFVDGRASTTVRRTTYKRGVTAGDLRSCYPLAVGEALRSGVAGFERRFRGFTCDEAVLIGVETRTSAPVTKVAGRGDPAGRRGVHPCAPH